MTAINANNKGNKMTSHGQIVTINSTTTELINATLTETQSDNWNNGHTFISVGDSALNLTNVDPGSATIFIAAGSVLHATDHVGLTQLMVGGPGKLDFISAAFTGGQVTLGADLVGSGTIGVQDFGVNHPGSVTATKSVGGGVTFSVTNDGQLTLSDIPQFHGAIAFQTGIVELAGVKATSGELLHGILTLFNGSRIVEQARFANSTAGLTDPNPLQLFQSAQGVAVVREEFTGVFQLPVAGTAIPLHVG